METNSRGVDKMKVKIGNKIHDAKNEPIMIILGEQDKENIKNMLPDATKYLCYPDDMGEEEAVEFMKIED